MAKKQEAAAEAAASDLDETKPAVLFEGSGEDGFELDMESVDENAGGFAVMPKGMYPAVLDDLVYGLSQNSGNPMWTWTWEVSEGEFKGRKLFFHSPFVPTMMGRFKKIVSRIAPDLAKTKFNPKEVADTGQLLGITATLRVDIKPYQGEQRNNVRDILAPSSGGADSGDGFLAG